MIRVLVVDDSALVRKILTQELSRFPDIEVVGSAVDPYAARDKIVALNPDVVTLDVEMPRMDGLSFLERLMRYHPKPVIVVSSLTPEHGELAIRAMALGAVDVIAKPGSALSVPDVADRLAHAVRAASAAHVERRVALAPAPAAGAAAKKSPALALRTTDKIVAIGASTGGTRAIEVVLRELPPDCPGVLIVQHMPERFTESLARRLDSVCRIEVREAKDNDPVVPGVALIAPGGRHMELCRSGARYYVMTNEAPPRHFQRPAVDVLFNSAAAQARGSAVAALLTGMGADGADGLLRMRKAGAHTIAEDERTCVVYGMPKEAIDRGAAEEVLPLDQVARGIINSRVLQGEMASVS